MDISLQFRGKVISYAEFRKSNICRDLFITNEVKECKELLFLPSIVFETEIRENRTKTYKIVLMGCLTNGKRVNVVLDGIKPYFEVLIPEVNSDIFKKLSKGEDYTLDTYIQDVCDLLLSDTKTEYTHISSQLGKPFKGYHEQEQKFLRFYYNSTKKRKDAIIALQKLGYPTYADDLSNYYRVVCRNYRTTFCSWAKLTKYRSHDFESLKGKTYRLDIKNFLQVPSDGITPELLKEKSLIMCWDIETMPSDVDGNIPKPENLDDKMPCIGISYHWFSEKKPLLQIVLSMFPAAPNPDYLTVICGSEKNIMLGFAELVERMRPESITGFNDGDYDWDWIITRASQTKGLLSSMAEKMSAVKHWAKFTDDNVLKYNVRNEHVKISAEESMSPLSLIMTGYLTVDTRVMFKKKFPTSNKSSLKYYLDVCRLNSKEDMAYKRMFQIYHDIYNLSKCEGVEWDTSGSSIHYDFEEGTSDSTINRYLELLEQNMLVNKYCVVDAQRCQDLLLAQSVFMDNREVSVMAYCSLFDALYRANAMKVRNLTIAIGQEEPFRLNFSSKVSYKKSEHKYPGAYVIPPERGLKTSKLSIVERIKKSSYPGNTDCVKWRNTTDEEIEQYYKIIDDVGPAPANINDVISKYGVLDERFVEFLTEKIGRPITGLDFASLYPSLIRAYNFSPEYCVLDKKVAKTLHEKGVKLHRVVFQFGPKKCEAWFIFHNNEFKTHIDGQPNPKFKFGIYGYILDFLAAERKKVKKEMEKYRHIRERVEANGNDYVQNHKDEYDDIIFMENYFKSKQLALKVFMNTFYGETGNQNSPFFLVEVAGGITTYGQKSLKKAKRFVEERGCHVYYGDTDSIYLSTSEDAFLRHDVAYYTGRISKLDYWTEMVRTTFNEISPLNTGVNGMFMDELQNDFLQMAYEEVLYPVIFTAKKKYYGIPHERIPNFYPQKLFIRGLDVIKRGVSKLLRTTFNKIMWDSVNPDNLYTIMELVINKIDEIYSTKWSDDEFVKTATYRKNKKNVSVHRFVDRMHEKGHIIKNGESFNYVIVSKYMYDYDYRGRKNDIKVGDRMEFPETVRENNMSIDLDYYMKGGINGQLSRLVTYAKAFQVEPAGDTEDDIKRSEDKIYNNACKFIDEYCKKYYSKYNNMSKTYRNIFKLSDKYITNGISDRFTLGIMSASFKKDPEKICTDSATQTQFIDWLTTMIAKKMEKKYKNYGRDILENVLDNLSKKSRKVVVNHMQRIYYGKGYNSIEKKFIRQFNEEYNKLITIIQKNTNVFAYIYSKYQSCVNELNAIIRNSVDFNDECFSEVKEAKNIELDINIDDSMDLVLHTKSKEFNEKLESDDLYQQYMDIVRTIYKRATVIYSNKYMNESIITRLKEIRNIKSGYINRPDNLIKEQIHEFVNDSWRSVVKLKI